ncbi:MAG: flavin reductase family protein [Oceanospirillaceae bacterium]|nr:flavin reductase family protein [Oceanospirillaceae bacterium]
MPFDSREFRNALGQFPTGVAIITAQDGDDQLIGITMSSFNSVSMDPPLVLFSLDRRALSLEAMEKADHYAVNVLSQDQQDLSNKFARAMENKWEDVGFETRTTGAPLLNGAIAHFECKPYAQYDGGDHVIFVGEVVSYSSSDHSAPLVFCRGRYAEIA